MMQFAVIGNPIEHSLSPDLHNYVYKLLSINALYKKKKVLHSELSNIMEAIKTGEFNGVNVTIQHKENIIE